MKMQRPRTCPQCGKEFLAKTRQNRYCSRQCQQIYYELHKRGKTPQTKQCAYCGKDFPPKQNQVYCSEQCKKYASSERRANRIAREAAEWDKGVCDICGKEYAKKIPAQRYCSIRCKAIADGETEEHVAWLEQVEQRNNGECIRCTRPAEPGEQLCKYHIEIQARLKRERVGGCC